MDSAERERESVRPEVTFTKKDLNLAAYEWRRGKETMHLYIYSRFLAFSVVQRSSFSDSNPDSKNRNLVRVAYVS